jgi:phenylacetate-coenzyme A ligase PaaK-like adenylate-forming protein
MPASSPLPVQREDQVEDALSWVPYYASWRSGAASGEPCRVDLPVLTKKALRAHLPRGFMRAGMDFKKGLASGEIELVATSGTADERLTVVWNQAWWDRSEREAARIHPVLDRIFSTDHREAVLASPVCAGNLCHMGKSSLKDRTLGGLLFLNQTPDPTAWDPRAIHRMAGELESFSPAILEADPAYLGILARACLREGLSLYQPSAIVLTYEFPSRVHLRQVHQAFPGVPVISSYGSTETGHVFTQCGFGTFHQNTSTCRVELEPLAAGWACPGVGRLLVSTLGNPWFTLLRFDVGDLARGPDGPCPCGRPQGMSVSAIEGRTREVSFTTDGRAVTLKSLDDALEPVTGLTGYCLEQTAPARYEVRFTADAPCVSHARDALQDILVSLYGRAASVTTRAVPVLPPEQSGKFRLAGALPAASPGALF